MKNIVDYGLGIIFLGFAITAFSSSVCIALGAVLLMATAYIIYNIIQKRVYFKREEKLWRFLTYKDLWHEWENF